MPNHLSHMKKARLIIRLFTDGVCKKTISEKSSCSRNTVKKYIRQYIAPGIPFEELDKLSNTSLEALFRTEPPTGNVKLEMAWN